MLCRRCQEEFTKTVNGNFCEPCVKMKKKIKDQRYRENNREKVAKRQRDYYAKNKTKIIENKRARRRRVKKMKSVVKVITEEGKEKIYGVITYFLKDEIMNILVNEVEEKYPNYQEFWLENSLQID